MLQHLKLGLLASAQRLRSIESSLHYKRRGGEKRGWHTDERRQYGIARDVRHCTNGVKSVSGSSEEGRQKKTVLTSSHLTLSNTHSLSLSLFPWPAFETSIITATGLISLISSFNLISGTDSKNLKILRRLSCLRFLFYEDENHIIIIMLDLTAIWGFYRTISWIFYSALCVDCVLWFTWAAGKQCGFGNFADWFLTT